MPDITEPPGHRRLAPGVSVPEEALAWSQSRSGGPGGQHVNTTATKAELRVDPAAIVGLHPLARARLLALAAARLDAEGRLLFQCDETRSLRQNQGLAFERLAQLVLAALVVPRPRRPTRPGRAARERRLHAKGHRARTKRERRPGGDDA